MKPMDRPKVMIAHHCLRVHVQNFGRVTSTKITAAMIRRSDAVAQLPACGNNCTASAAPSWSAMHEPKMQAMPIAVPVGAGVLAVEVGADMATILSEVSRSVQSQYRLLARSGNSDLRKRLGLGAKGDTKNLSRVTRSEIGYRTSCARAHQNAPAGHAIGFGT